MSNTVFIFKLREDEPFHMSECRGWFYLGTKTSAATKSVGPGIEKTFCRLSGDSTTRDHDH